MRTFITICSLLIAMSTAAQKTGTVKLYKFTEQTFDIAVKEQKTVKTEQFATVEAAYEKLRGSKAEMLYDLNTYANSITPATFDAFMQYANDVVEKLKPECTVDLKGISKYKKLRKSMDAIGTVPYKALWPANATYKMYEESRTAYETYPLDSRTKQIEVDAPQPENFLAISYVDTLTVDVADIQDVESVRLLYLQYESGKTRKRIHFYDPERQSYSKKLFKSDEYTNAFIGTEHEQSDVVTYNGYKWYSPVSIRVAKQQAKEARIDDDFDDWLKAKNLMTVDNGRWLVVGKGKLRLHSQQKEALLTKPEMLSDVKQVSETLHQLILQTKPHTVKLEKHLQLYKMKRRLIQTEINAWQRDLTNAEKLLDKIGTVSMQLNDKYGFYDGSWSLASDDIYGILEHFQAAVLVSQNML